MNKIKLIVLATLSTLSVYSYSNVQMWCLKNTTECSYGTPSGLTTSQRSATIYRMTEAQYIASVLADSFVAITPPLLRTKAIASIPTPAPAPAPAPAQMWCLKNTT